MKKSNNDWHLDLRPARRPTRTLPAMTDVAPEPAPQQVPEQVPQQVPQELIDLVDEVRRTVAVLDARIQKIERVIDRAQRPRAAPPKAAVDPAPAQVPNAAPAATKVAPPAEPRRARAKRLRSTPLPDGAEAPPIGLAASPVEQRQETGS